MAKSTSFARNTPAGRVTVSTRALVQRINRKLAQEGEQLKATRGGQAQIDLGDYYLLDLRLNAVVGKNIDPERLGRELGVLAKWEILTD